MDLNTRSGGASRCRNGTPRHADIGYIAGRLQRELISARDPLMNDEMRLHNVCRTAVLTIVRMTSTQPFPAPFDIDDGLGELGDVLLAILRSEYRLILDPEPAPGLVDTIALATGGLMLRGAAGLLDPDLDHEVDLQLAALARLVA